LIVCLSAYQQRVPSLDFEARRQVCLGRLSGLIEGVKGREGRRKPSLLGFHTLETLD
jgi:hypothetical protein